MQMCASLTVKPCQITGTTLKLYFYLAEYQPKDRTGAGGGIKAEGEDIDVLEMTLEEALRGIETGKIVDGKTIMLLYHIALKGIM